MTPHPNLAAVTGAFSYTGRYVTRHLVDQGVRVRTLTRNPNAENPFGGHLEVAPLDFSDPDGLCQSMQGAGVFYNTYWVRYAHGRVTFDLAVENTRTLFEAARTAGVGRIVHFSVTNPIPGVRPALLQRQGPGGRYAEGSRCPLRYHQADSGLRRRRTCCSTTWPGHCGASPSSPSTASGDYPVQPVYVEDVAAQAVEAGSQSESSVADAAGPDTISFEALLRLLASSTGVRARLVRTPPSVGLAADPGGRLPDA